MALPPEQPLELLEAAHLALPQTEEAATAEPLALVPHVPHAEWRETPLPLALELH